MIYKCNYPKCEYCSKSRTCIHYHHIIPKELGGSNDNSNRVWLCPTHHSHIYIEESKKGHHSKINDQSIILIGWRKSTEGKVLLYKKPNSEEILIENAR